MDLLGLESLRSEDVLAYLDLAEHFVDEDQKVRTPPEYRDALDGETVALMFFEPSTRTRASFELAVQRLGAYPLVMMSQASSIKKGETILDTCQNLEAMGVRGFVVRHSERTLPSSLAERLDSPVFNAGNGTGEHPTQALLDVFTLRRYLGRRDLEGVNVSIIGDIIHSRVARSDVYALRALGAKVTLAGPSHLLPKQSEGWDAELATNRKDALAEADAVIMLRIQRERMVQDVDLDEYVVQWGVDEAVVRDEMKPNAVIMHPGPVMRGVELSSGVTDGDRSLILKQAANGVAIRQSVLLRSLAPQMV